MLFLGADGDGVAHDETGKPLFIPLTLPGEVVEAALRTGPRAGRHAVASRILERSADRVAPRCIHFGICGGCALQHAGDAAYVAWKTLLLTRALERAGYDKPAIGALQRSDPGTRRRVDLAVRRASGAILVGLHERHTGAVVDVHECHVLAPKLVALIGALRRVLPRIQALRREASAVINLLDSGPDVLLRTDGPLNASDRSIFATFAEAEGISRIHHAIGQGEPEAACLLRPATTVLSGLTIRPPPGAFLQATPQGEAAIIAAVLAGLPVRLPAKAWVADLYAGVGTLTFALATRARVQAWERDGAALAALRAGAGSGITVQVRDLVRQPVRQAELAKAAAVVLDPPWAGAPEQVAHLASPVVIYVSCNPVALSRDAAVLRGNGYRLTAATPIDQFLWSSRLESVSVFVKGS